MLLILTDIDDVHAGTRASVCLLWGFFYLYYANISLVDMAGQALLNNWSEDNKRKQRTAVINWDPMQ